MPFCFISGLLGIMEIQVILSYNWLRSRILLHRKVQECMNLRKVYIRLDLTDEAAEQFLSLKAKRGLKHTSELIRQLITEAVRQELPQAP